MRMIKIRITKLAQLSQNFEILKACFRNMRKANFFRHFFSLAHSLNNSVSYLKMFLCKDWQASGSGALTCRVRGGGCVRAQRIRSKTRCNRSTSHTRLGPTFDTHSTSSTCRTLSCLPRSMQPSNWAAPELTSFGNPLCIKPTN